MTSLDDRLLAALAGASRDDTGLGDRLHLDSDVDDGATNAGDSDDDAGSGVFDPVAAATADETDEDRLRVLDDAMLRRAAGLGPQTGPKSVLADRSFHRKQENLRNAARRAEFASQLDHAALPAGWLERELARDDAARFGSPDPRSSRLLRPRLDSDRTVTNADVNSHSDLGTAGILDNNFDDDDDDAFLQTYRRRRLHELSKLASAPTFGSVRELISHDQMLREIESEDPAVEVILYLYHPAANACSAIDTAFAELAATIPTTKFLRMLSTVADPDFDTIALPALLIYRAGDTSDVLLRVHDDIPDFQRTGRISSAQLRQYLTKNGVLLQDSRTQDSIEQLRFRAVAEALM